MWAWSSQMKPPHRAEACAATAANTTKQSERLSIAARTLACVRTPRASVTQSLHDGHGPEPNTSRVSEASDRDARVNCEVEDTTSFDRKRARSKAWRRVRLRSVSSARRLVARCFGRRWLCQWQRGRVQSTWGARRPAGFAAESSQ